MKKTLLALALALGLTAPTTAQADESGYKLARGVGYAGLITAGAAPLVTGAGAVVVFSSVDVEEDSEGGLTGSFDAGQAGAGVVMVLTGVSFTALAPGVVVGSSIAGNFSVKDMGGKPSLVPGIIGASGVGIQLAGIAMAASGSSGNLPVRVLGWSTGLIGGGVQMSTNAKHYRDAAGLAHGGHRKKVHVALVPRFDGVGLVGTF